MSETTQQPATIKRWLPYAAIGVAVFFLSSGAIFVRLAQAEQMPSLAITAIRFVFAVLLLAPWVLARHTSEIRRLRRRDFGLIALAGFALSLGLLFFFLALEHTTVLIANLLTNTHPLWVALIEVLILKAVLGRRVWAGMGLALGGGTLFALSASGGGTVSMGPDPLLGGIIALAAALFAAAYFLLGRLIRAQVSALVYLWLALLIGGVIMLLVMLMTGTALVGYPSQGYMWILLMTVTGQIIGQGLLVYALAHLPATFISISVQAVVILSALLAFIVFQEQPGPTQIIASVVILVGVVVAITGKPPAPVVTENPNQ